MCFKFNHWSLNINSSLNETILWPRFFGYFVYHVQIQLDLRVRMLFVTPNDWTENSLPKGLFEDITESSGVLLCLGAPLLESICTIWHPSSELLSATYFLRPYLLFTLSGACGTFLASPFIFCLSTLTNSALFLNFACTTWSVSGCVDGSKPVQRGRTCLAFGGMPYGVHLYPLRLVLGADTLSPTEVGALSVAVHPDDG